MIVRCNWLSFGRVRLVFSALCLLLFLGVTNPVACPNLRHRQHAGESQGAQDH